MCLLLTYNFPSGVDLDQRPTSINQGITHVSIEGNTNQVSHRELSRGNVNCNFAGPIFIPGIRTRRGRCLFDGANGYNRPKKGDLAHAHPRTERQFPENRPIAGL